MNSTDIIAIADVESEELLYCTWGRFAVDNLEGGGMEIEELNDIEATLDKNLPHRQMDFVHHIGGGASSEYFITRHRIKGEECTSMREAFVRTDAIGIMWDAWCICDPNKEWGDHIINGCNHLYSPRKGVICEGGFNA